MTLTGPVHIADRDKLLDDLSSVITAAAMRAVEGRGVFHLALSGGSTPEPLYVRMVIDPRFRVFPWDLTHVWIVDERQVPYSDERSNFRMIRETLIDHVPLRRRQVHPIPVEGDDPAAAYQRLLEQHVAQMRLDFVLLGMGHDGHTASLFPGSPAIEETSRLVAANDGPTVTPPARITMTLPLLNRAREVAVLVTGEAKTATLRQVEVAVRDGGIDVRTLPITGVEPTEGEVTWYLDQTAAGEQR